MLFSNFSICYASCWWLVFIFITAVQVDCCVTLKPVSNPYPPPWIRNDWAVRDPDPYWECGSGPDQGN